MNSKFILTVSIVLLGLASLSMAQSTACTSDASCNNGVCKNSTCVCTLGYVTFGNQTCNYKQKEKLTAFLLSFFVGNFGADWFYLASGNGGYIVAGIFKLITGIFLIGGSCFLCCTMICSAVDKSSIKACGIVLSVIVIVLMILCSLTNSIWYLVDWIRILTNSFKDGNGVSLKDW